MNEQEERIRYYRSLTTYSNHEEALNLLKKIASHVKPIMKKRNWRVGSLEEFWPAERGLLGVNINRGERICIRLRPHYDEGQFFDFNDLIGTMLHELTHLEIAPHDERFYKLLDELNDEYDVLLANGYSGEGFFSNGIRLGQGISHNVPPDLVRQKALEAAEKRRRIEGLMPEGGRRLGGGERYGLSLRELAAMAAERRRRDNLWCGSKPKNGNNNNNNNRLGTSSGGRIPPNKIPVRIPTEKLPVMRNSWENIEWTCLACTFVNRPMSLQCDVCLAERILEIETSTSLTQPVIIDDDDNPFLWSCPGCSFKNAPDIVMCLGCDYFRDY